MSRPIVVLADADERLLQRLSNDATLRPRDVIAATDLPRLVRAIDHLPDDGLLLADTRRSGRTAWIDAARRVRDCRVDVVVVAIPTHSTEERVIAALRAGVDDYHRRPLDVAALRASVGRLRMLAHDLVPPQSARRHRYPASAFPDLVGTSDAMSRVRGAIEMAAGTDSPVLLLGETGTGKDLVARLIHEHGRHRAGRFVAINCAAIPDTLLESELFGHQRGAFTGATVDRRGAFELAHRGTLLLDEIGDMSAHAQAKLLRVLEARSVRRLGDDRERATDFRLITATHRDLASLVDEGRFRADLFYRIEVLRIDLPPVRERKEDLPILCKHFLDDIGRRLDRRVKGFSQEALGILLSHDWPGNVRELRNALESIAVTLNGRRVESDNLPRHLAERFRSTPLPMNERDRVLAALFATDWNKSRAAEKLQWSRMTLYRKMNKYGIRRRDGSLRDDPASQ